MAMKKVDLSAITVAMLEAMLAKRKTSAMKLMAKREKLMERVAAIDEQLAGSVVRNSVKRHPARKAVKAAKRGRKAGHKGTGRPRGSKNKPKVAVEVPTPEQLANDMPAAT